MTLSRIWQQNQLSVKLDLMVRKITFHLTLMTGKSLYFIPHPTTRRCLGCFGFFLGRYHAAHLYIQSVVWNVSDELGLRGTTHVSTYSVQTAVAWVQNQTHEEKQLPQFGTWKSPSVHVQRLCIPWVPLYVTVVSESHPSPAQQMFMLLFTEIIPTVCRLHDKISPFPLWSPIK